ncbi:MAG: DUF4270 family protein [Bacteroidetes bacterium]|nr:DUF4270 family protein [Bacteroidota bacterium]
MRSRIFLLMMVVLLIWSCEDPTTLPVSNIFNNNRLQTAYIDTFSVITSTVQLDTVLTNGSGTMLLGKYHDDRLGDVSSSTYFQLNYKSTFLPDKQFIFDSAVLILPYSHNYVGDTTVPLKINVHQLSEPMRVRLLPPTADLKLSVYNSTYGFFNSSKQNYYPNPIVSVTTKLSPHTDSLNITLPYSFGANWFRLAQFDSAQIFSNSVNFTNYFNGFHINVDPGQSSCVADFNVNKIKLRMYYKLYNGDFLINKFVDFIVQNPFFQFNHIEFDRSTGSETALAASQKFQAVSTLVTNNTAYVQSGTGLVAQLYFPSIKNFFSINNGVTLNAAYLEVYPVSGSYPYYSQPPKSVQLYTTDNSNIPLASVPGGSAGITYDYEYGINTFYRFDLFSFIFSQIHNNQNYITPLILGPPLSPGIQGSSVKRLYFGDRFHGQNKIKLKIYYSYSLK